MVSLDKESRTAFTFMQLIRNENIDTFNQCHKLLG